MAPEGLTLQVLMTYTVFHIGAYLSLTTLLMSATVFGRLSLRHVKLAIGCFLLAGACGGIIAANAAEYLGGLDEFFTTYELNIWGFPIPYLLFRYVARVEHSSFWLGIGFVAFGFFGMRWAADTSPRSATAAERLEELRALLERKLITQRQFDQKQEEIVIGL